MTPPRPAARRPILKGLGFVLYNLIAATVLLETIIVVMLHVPRITGASPFPVRRLIQQIYRHFNRMLIQFDPNCARGTQLSVGRRFDIEQSWRSIGSASDRKHGHSDAACGPAGGAVCSNATGAPSVCQKNNVDAL